MSDNTEKIYIAKVEEVIGKTGKNFYFASKARVETRFLEIKKYPKNIILWNCI